MLNTENIESKFHSIIQTEEWKLFLDDLSASKNVYVIGNGGNWGVATHGVADNFKMSAGKRFFSLDSACYITAASNDWGYENLFLNWLKHMNKNGDLLDNESLVIGLTSSGNSNNIIKGLKWASDNGIKTALITGKASRELQNYPNTNTKEVVLDVEYYHSAEILTLWLFYEMVHASGSECPLLDPNRAENVQKNVKQWSGVRKHSYPDETINIAIDFDGVIHRADKGFYDGTIYDEEVEGAREALLTLSQVYNIIVYTAKARSDRPLVNGKTGQELVWEWLREKGLSQYVTEVACEKPRAVCYIDDKGIKFTSWKDAMSQLKEHNLLAIEDG